MKTRAELSESDIKDAIKLYMQTKGYDVEKVEIENVHYAADRLHESDRNVIKAFAEVTRK